MYQHPCRGLLNAVFYVTGKMFCLRGGKEHRDLKLSQLQRTAGKYTYYENVSKNHNGSFAQLHVQSKVVPLYKNPDLGDRCPVFILDKYISRLPAKAKADDIFWTDSSQPVRKKRKLYLRDTTLTIPQCTRYRHSRKSTVPAIFQMATQNPIVTTSHHQNHLLRQVILLILLCCAQLAK